MSIVVAAQPHFKNQPLDTTIFWGYGLYTEKIGDYVKKPMRDCTGEELLTELLHHLHMEDKLEEIKEKIETQEEQIKKWINIPMNKWEIKIDSYNIHNQLALNQFAKKLKEFYSPKIF